MTSPVPLLFCIDVEPDYTAPFDDGSRACAGFGVLADRLNAMRPRLEDATGHPVHFSWYVRMDPHIEKIYGSTSFLVDSDVARFTALREAGDEIGVHVHPYAIDEATGKWVDRFTEPSVIEESLEVSFDTYERVFGTTCPSFTFGALFMNEQILEVAERRGVRYDLSGVPGTPATRTGTPDYGAMPLQPYFPDRTDFRVPGAEGSRQIREVPQTSLDSSRWRHRLVRRFRGEQRPYHRTHAMWNARHISAERYWRLAAANLDRLPMPYFCHVLRSEALVVDRISAVVDPILQQLVRDPILQRVRFQTVTEWLG